MSKSSEAWVSVMMLILFGCFVQGDAAAQDRSAISAPIWFATEVSIAPDGDAAGLWRCEALLSDLGSGEVLSAPTIVFAEGESASVQSGLPSEMLWELEVEASAGGESVAWSSRVTMGEQVLSMSTGSVQLNVE